MKMESIRCKLAMCRNRIFRPLDEKFRNGQANRESAAAISNLTSVVSRKIINFREQLHGSLSDE